MRRPRRPRMDLAPACALALVLTGVVAGLLATPGTARAAHSHYLRLLQQGTFALERGELDDAVGDLRLACFGLLEEPALLGECLVRLGLAQAAAGEEDGFRATFRRVVEVQERFRGYDRADLTADERVGFEEAVVAHIAPRTLRYSDAFDHLAPARETPEEAGRAPAEQADEAENASGRRPTADRPTADRPPAERPSRREDRATDILSDEEQASLRQARTLLAEARRRSDLDEPLRLARQVAEANPGSREAQHLAAVIAYRASRWEEAVRFFRRGGDPRPEDAEALFYFAVSLYETGARDEAAAALRRSLPRLEETPFVQRYREKILGPADGGSTP